MMVGYSCLSGALFNVMAPVSAHGSMEPVNRQETAAGSAKSAIDRFGRLGLAGALAVSALAAWVGSASAQGKLDARYTATLAGIPIGRGAWVVDIDDKQFTAVVSGGTAGLFKFFAPGEGTGAARGVVAEGRPVGKVFSSTLVVDKKPQVVRIALENGGVKDFTITPPERPNPRRIPITEADRRAALDPMSAALFRVPDDGNVFGPEACAQQVPVFDGRMRYDLKFAFKRIEMVSADKGYKGPAVVCEVHFLPLGGYVEGNRAIRYLANLSDIEAWVVPIAGTRVVVPFRLSLPTPIGQAGFAATQFITTPTPRPATTTTQ